ncbi:MAG: protein kinase [Ignavibacteria bacterium]|nr:protein kinase [Ignavibacteria bacterium]
MIDKTISHYKVLEKLGGGGMGIVYKAQDLNLDRFVALKFLSPNIGADDEEKKRFILEARAASSLEHNNICTVYEIGEAQDGQIFIALAYYDGETLKKKIQKGPLKVTEALDITIQIAEGLSKAHGQGIVHRDIKLANIMITNQGVIKILDFGLAKLSGQSRITVAGTTLGTIAYMSPEQAAGDKVDHRTDIWSLGVVLYEMLTGEVPFKAEHEIAIIYMIMNEEILPPSSLDRKIPHQVDSLFAKLLQKDQNKRHQNMEELIKELKIIRDEIETSTTAAKVKAIAVLPFENISPDKENDYFSDGLTEELIINLSRLKNMRIISRTTSMQFKGTKKDIKTIGREIGARYVIEGSVRKAGDNLRIAAQLIDVENDSQLWAESFKGKLADIFDIQEKVSKDIVDALMLKLSPTEKVGLTKRATLNPEAFDYALRARDALYRLTKNNVHLAIQLFTKAIELDPRYAVAHAGLGEAYATLYQYFESNDTYLDKAIESSLKALMYDPTLSEAYTALGLAYFDKKHLDEAITYTLKAIELDSENFIAYWILGRIYYTTDRDDEAIQQFKKTIQLNSNFYNAYNDILMTYERRNDVENAKKILEEVLQIIPAYLSKYPDDARAHMYHAIHLAEVNRVEEAKAEGKKALELNPGDSLMTYNAACLYARLGDKHLAAVTLRDAVAAGQEDFEWIKRDADLESIRNEPEYIELMRGK